MEHLFDGIGGFYSWPFAIIAFGGIILGMALVAVFRYWGIIGIAGGFPIFAYLSAEANQASALTSDPILVGAHLLVPLGWFFIWVLVMVSMAGRTGLAKGLNRK